MLGPRDSLTECGGSHAEVELDQLLSHYSCLFVWHSLNGPTVAVHSIRLMTSDWISSLQRRLFVLIESLCAHSLPSSRPRFTQSSRVYRCVRWNHQRTNHILKHTECLGIIIMHCCSFPHLPITSPSTIIVGNSQQILTFHSAHYSSPEVKFQILSV